MRIFKDDLAMAIDKVKNVVSKQSPLPALTCALISSGYLTAANTDMTVKIKLKMSDGEQIMLPARSFDLIRSLPQGMLDITQEGQTLTISADRISNKYQTHDPMDFPDKDVPAGKEGMLKVPGDKFIDAASRVMYAASDDSVNLMSAICLDLTNEMISAVALDGHVVAWNECEVSSSISEQTRLLVPKMSMQSLLAMGMADSSDIYISTDGEHAIFMTDRCVLYTRLLSGNYFKYERIFDFDGFELQMGRRAFLEALNRTKCCNVERPIVMDIDGQKLRISTENADTHYAEDLLMDDDCGKQLTVGFDLRLLTEAVKNFPEDKLHIRMGGSKAPMLISGKDTKLRELVLPVNISR